MDTPSPPTPDGRASASGSTFRTGRSRRAFATIERLNGGSSAEENDLAGRMAQEYGFHCVGGSDSHYVSTIGRCITRFDRRITRIEELLEELNLGDFDAVRLEDTRA